MEPLEKTEGNVDVEGRWAQERKSKTLVNIRTPFQGIGPGYLKPTSDASHSPETELAFISAMPV